MTEVLHIIVAPAGGGRLDAFIDGRYQLTSTSPLIDRCRILIERGIDPETPVAMRHAGSDYDAVWGRVGAIAGLGVRGTRTTRTPGPAARPYSDLIAQQGGARTTPEADA